MQAVPEGTPELSAQLNRAFDFRPFTIHLSFLFRKHPRPVAGGVCSSMKQSQNFKVVGAMTTSPRQKAAVSRRIFGEFVIIKRADVGIGPYKSSTTA